MWQLRKLSTNEALSEVGPLPINWGSIFGLHGFLDKIGDLSWLGPDYEDKGWVQLTEAEQHDLSKNRIASTLNSELELAKSYVDSRLITVQQKIMWEDHIVHLTNALNSLALGGLPEVPARPR